MSKFADLGVKYRNMEDITEFLAIEGLYLHTWRARVVTLLKQASLRY